MQKPIEILEKMRVVCAEKVLLAADLPRTVGALIRFKRVKILGEEGGRIVNISSSIGRLPYPWFAAYEASNTFVSTFGESLVAKLAGRSIEKSAAFIQSL